MRITEVYNLECYGCGADLELAATERKANGQHSCCPKCGVELVIEFRPATATPVSPSSERTTSPEPVESRLGR